MPLSMLDDRMATWECEWRENGLGGESDERRGWEKCSGGKWMRKWIDRRADGIYGRMGGWMDRINGLMRGLMEKIR